MYLPLVPLRPYEPRPLKAKYKPKLTMLVMLRKVRRRLLRLLTITTAKDRK
jgi:hypothetical protein